MARKSRVTKFGKFETKVAPTLKATVGPDSAPATVRLPVLAANDPVFAFPNKSRCPKCGVTTTECLSVVGPIQYRRCQAPICRHPYKVTGSPI
jgi:hypothetical protein